MAEPNDRFIAGDEHPEDQIDRALRPSCLREMIGQTAACVRALEGIGACIEKNARAMEDMRLALDSVARQEACILDLQHRLYAELAKRAGPGAN